MSEWEPGGPGPSPLFGGLFVSARWYPLYTGATGSTIVVQGHLYAVPFYVGTSHQFTAIGAFITTGGSAGATAELGIYADNGKGYPGALVLDAGSVAVVSTGATAEISGLTQTLAPGLYWLVYGATGSPADPDAIGQAYIGAVSDEIAKWLRHRATDGPVGVCFSGGVDSGSVFLLVYHAMLRLGMNPSRLKAFSLAVDGGGDDLTQARWFLDAVGLGLFLEPVEAPRSAVDWREAVRVIEDYKPLDVQSAAMALALCRGIRSRYPEWRHLIDGDGGDENLKDYPIEENPELTIRSVLNNRMLYQEGWGVDAIKHSLTYSGGLSRGYARTYAPAAACGFEGFSPYTLPNVVEVAEAIPFIELTDWDHERLYALKGEVVKRGVKAVAGIDMPVFPKRRFQHGAPGREAFAALFPSHPSAYRRAYHAAYDS